MATNRNSEDRVKELFSSFLCKFNHNDNRNEVKGNDSVQSEKVTQETCLYEDCDNSHNKKLLFERVETFSPLTWFAKPTELSPLVCAMYGWKNVDKDMLQCVNCKVFLSGELSKPTDAALYRESCNTLKRNLIESHDRLCKWQLNPCQDSLITIPCHDREELLKQFKKRSTSLQYSSAPNINYNTLESYGMTEEKLLDLVTDLHKHDKISEDRCTEMDICALCGWYTRESHKDILKCEYCQRKIGLWNFCNETNIVSMVTSTQKTSNNVVCEQTEENNETVKNNEINKEKSVDEHTNIIDVDNESNKCDKRKKDNDNEMHAITVLDESRIKKQKVEKNSFDPISEHRYWCPWLQTCHKYSNKILESCRVVSPLKSTIGQCVDDRSPSKTNPNFTSVPTWLLAMKILGQSVADGDCMQLKQSPQNEGLRHLRRILHQCTSHKSQQNLKTK